MRILAPAAALAIATTLLLGGCVPTEPTASPTPEPSSTPVFASEEEALAAAEEAYAAYQSAVDHALATYETDGLELVATADALAAVLESVTELQGKGQRQTGISSVDSLTIAQPEDPLQVYACLDITQTDLIDASGNSVVPESRQDRFPVLVSLMLAGEGSALLVSSEEIWDGDDFCN